ncbi:MAG: hypothetical protein GWP91_17530, partial [Rhodobacterales bacterium]|nr:hypothetical protein [Rhodobacterales bacterium]
MTPWLFWMLACHAPEQPPEAELDGPLQPLSEAPYTTLQTTWAPLEPPEQVRADMESGALMCTDLDQFIGAGLGVVQTDGA